MKIKEFLFSNLLIKVFSLSFRFDALGGGHRRESRRR